MEDETKKIMDAIRNGDEIRLVEALATSGHLVNQLDGEDLPLVESVYHGPSLVRRLLEAGADVNARDGNGRTALIQATSLLCDHAVVKLLLDSGADPNIVERTSVTALNQTAHGKTQGDAEAAKLLIEAGADVNFMARTPKGVPTGSVLMAAAGTPNREIVRQLLEAGARVDVLGALGTPLTSAVEGGDATIVRLLLERGADPSVCVPADSFDRKIAGLSALDIAFKKKRTAIVDLLSGDVGKPRPAAHANVPLEVSLETLKNKRPSRVRETFNVAADPQDLAWLTATLGMALPADLVQLLSIHDGQVDSVSAHFIVGSDDDELFRLLSAREIGREWTLWKTLLDAGEFKSRKAEPDDGVRPEWFNPNWIPITSNGAGDSHCIDCSPGPSGTVGQIIMVCHEHPDRLVVAPSLADWLDMLSEAK
jgi:cell wall assembly regulator SMI1/ankyrin repeat protein